MTAQPSIPYLNRPKRPKLALVAAMSEFSKRPTQTHYGHMGNGMNSALGRGFGHFGRFEGGIGQDDEQ
jgi:hypothetical protein